MTTTATAVVGASSTLLAAHWKVIDWKAAEAHVKRLQMRIAKATGKAATAKLMLCNGC